MANRLRVVVVAGQAPRRVALAESVRRCWKPDIAHIQARSSLPTGFNEVPSGNEALPDNFLVDLDIPARADAALRFLANAEANTGVIALLDNPDPEWVRIAVSEGISAILSRDAAASELRLAFQAAQAGLVLLHPTSARDLATVRNLDSQRPAFGQLLPSRLDGEPQPDKSLENLTSRESEVLRLMSRGLGNKEIAVQLGISEHTVKFHASSILGKLGVASRTEAVSHGIRQGLIPI